MKKRAKIITTIASLCLAVALMAFGVYAATSVTLGITSKVHFEVKDVFATITGAFEVDSGSNGAFATAAGDYYSADSTGVATFSYVTYTGTKGGHDMAAKTVTDPDAQTWYTGIANYSSSVKTARIVIKITNDAASGQDSIYAKVGSLIAQDSNQYTTVGNMCGVTDSNSPSATNATTVLAASDVNKFVEIEPGSTAVFVFIRILQNTSVDIAAMDMVTGGDASSSTTAITLTVQHEEPEGDNVYINLETE